MDYLVDNKVFKYILILNSRGQTQDNQDIEDGEFRGLSANFYPLKKYNPEILKLYNSREISVITSM